MWWSSKKTVFALALTLFLLALLLLPSGVKQRLESSSRFLMHPMENFSNRQLQTLREKLQPQQEQSQKPEINKLLAELTRSRQLCLQAELQAKSLVDENNYLKRLLRLNTNTREYSLVVCEVIRREPFSDYFSNIILNRGQNDGLKPGQAVVVPEGFVGIIRECSPSRAVVTLIASPQFTLSCQVPESRITGLLRCSDRSLAALPPRLTPPAALLLEAPSGTLFDHVPLGATVVTSSLGNENMQDGLLIGRISQIKADTAGAPYFLVEPATSLLDYKYVLVAIPAS